MTASKIVKTTCCKRTLYVDLLLIVFVTIAVVFIVGSRIPYYDDELIGYWGYSKLTREFFLTSQVQTTGALTLPGAIGQQLGPLILRSYEYVGWPQTVVLLPFLFISMTFEMVRLTALLSLGIIAWIVSRLYCVRPVYVFLPMMAFAPWSFQHLVDTGPNSYQFVLVVAVLAWFYRAENVPAGSLRSCVLFCLSGLALFLGVWIKLSFVFLLPGLLILAVFSIRRRAQVFGWRMVCVEALITAGAFALPTTLLLFSTDTKGLPYLNVIISNSDSGYLWSAARQWEHFIQKFGPLFMNPAYTAHWVKSFKYARVSYSSLLYLVLVVTTILAMYRLEARIRNRVFLPLFASVVTLLLINASAKSFAIHHLVYVCPFLLFFYVELITLVKSASQQRGIVLAISAFVIVWFEILRLPNSHDGRDASALSMIRALQGEVQPGDHVVVVGWGACFGATILLPKRVIVDCFFEKPLFVEKFKEHLDRLVAVEGASIVVLHQPSARLVSDMRSHLGDRVQVDPQDVFGDWIRLSWRSKRS